MPTAAAGSNLRPLSLLISGLCLMPMLLVLAAWALPLSEASAANWQHLIHTVLPAYSLGTLQLALGVALLSGSCGVATAWCITRCEFPLRRALSWLLVLPFAMPAYILATAYGQLLEFAGPVQTGLRALTGWQHGDYWFFEIRSMGGAVAVLALATFPYVYMLARLAFASQPQEWFEVAQALGHTRRALFWKVALPAARPFIVAGVALAVMESIADIGAVHMLGVPTLATGIYRTWFNFEEPLLAARLAFGLLLVAAVLVWLERITRGNARYASLQAAAPPPRRRLKPHKAWLVCAVCALPVVLGFALPLLWLCRMAWYAAPQGAATLLAAFGDSLLLGVLAALLVVACGFVLALAERGAGARLRYAQLAATLGYAMPGVVIAVGLLMLQQQAKLLSGSSLLLTGTLVGLLLAYLVRFLSPAYSTLHSGFQRLSPEMDMVAASLGKTRLQVAWHIHLPMLRMPVITAALMVAIDVFKELPATLILRPFDVRTLAIAVYEFAGDDRPAEAAPYALILVGMCTLAVYLLTRLQETNRGAS